MFMAMKKAGPKKNEENEEEEKERLKKLSEEVYNKTN